MARPAVDKDGMTVIGATEAVGRVFVCCEGCKRIRPYWDLVGASAETHGTCACGDARVRPRRVPEWRAAWWVLIRGLVWRKLLQRRANWDPRMPVRTRDHASPS